MIKQFFLTVALMLGVALQPAQAFDAKQRPITVVIPFAPGGGVDQTFRHFEKWANGRGLNFTVSYKPGAEGLIGMNEIAGMPRDGYHISFGTAGTAAVQRMKNPTAELELITGIKNSITAFITHKDSGITDFNGLYSVKGLTMAYGAPGQKMTMEQLQEISKGRVQGKMIPYKGGGPVVQDLLGNHVQLGAVPLIIARSHIDAGTLRLLAVGAKRRLAQFPTTPTIYEIYPDWRDNDGFAVFLPKGADKAAVEFWTKIMKQYLDDASVKADFVKDFNESNDFGAAALEKLITNAQAALSK